MIDDAPFQKVTCPVVPEPDIPADAVQADNTLFESRHKWVEVAPAVVPTLILPFTSRV